MGLGIIDLANAGEMTGHPYAMGEFMQFMEMVSEPEVRYVRDEKQLEKKKDCSTAGRGSSICRVNHHAVTAGGPA